MRALLQHFRCRRKSWLLAAGLMAALSAGASASDRFVVDVWTPDNGLPQSSVSSIVQTPDGYLWIGTRQGGLCRFDGVQFTKFSPANTPALTSIEIDRLFVDDQGKLWVAPVDNALTLWRDNTSALHVPPSVDVALRPREWLSTRSNQTIFATAAGLLLQIERQETNVVRTVVRPPPALAVQSYCEDKEGVLWYLTAQGKLGWWEDHRFKPLAKSALPSGWFVRTLVKGPGGQVWIGTDHGIAVWEDGRFQDMTPTNGGPRLAVEQMAFAGDGGLWVRTASRLFRCVGRQVVAEATGWEKHFERSTPSPGMNGDADGGVWLIQHGVGVWHVSAAGEVHPLTVGNGLPSALVEAWFQDREGNVWLGTSGGLARLRPRLFRALGSEQGMPAQVARSVCEDTDGNIWVGTANSLRRWGAGRWEQVTISVAREEVALAEVTVTPDAAGGLWVGTVGNGVRQYKGGKFIQPFPPTAAGAAIRAMHVDRQGNAWFGGEFGLFRWDGIALKKFGEEEGLPRGHVFAMAEDPAGGLWVTARAQLWHYREGRFTELSPADGRPNSRLLSVMVDDGRTVWVGTLGEGLLRLRDGKFFRYTQAHGLPNDTVTQLLADDLGHLWGGTHNGIFRVKKSALDDVAGGRAQTATFHLYGKNDGLPTVECSGGFQPACWRARDGRLWFATVQDAVVVNPKEIRENTLPPPVEIEEMRVDGKALTWAKAMTPSPNIIIAPGRHYLEIRFTGLSFGAPDRVRFRWKLEGADKDWVDGGNQRHVSYSFLPPGDYRFRVRACNNDNVWNETGASLTFRIEPFFWERHWFQTGAVAGLAGLTALIVALLLRARHRRKLARLDQVRIMERERARIAQDLHDDLGAGLTQITLSSDMAQKRITSPERVSGLLVDISSRARQLVTALDEIVWAVNPKNDSVPALASYFCQVAQYFLKPTAIACRLDVSADLPGGALNAEQRHSLFLAFQEALHNVVQHSGATEMMLVIAADGELRITVRDNGRGLPAEPPREGADGLRNMRERLQRLGGDCVVASQPSQGTEVIFRLPLRG